MASAPDRLSPKFAAAGFFVVRTPLLPFADFLAWSEGLEGASKVDDPAQLEHALSADWNRLEARLGEIVARPEIREALFVASPHLEESLEVWAREPESERGRGIALAVARYFVRMAARATPFGLCAGCSVGTIGAQTRLTLPGRAEYRRRTRLDMDYLDALCAALARDPVLRDALSYRVNSSLYRAAGRIRYIESRLEEKDRTFHLVAVEETEALAKTLDRAARGASLASLAEALVDDEISGAEAEEFIREVIASQMLVPDLAPGVTGADPLARLIEQLEKYPAAKGTADVLKTVKSELAALDANGLGNLPERYRAIARRLESLPAKVELPRLFQVDMFKPAATAMLSKSVLDEIARGIRVLHRLTPSSSEDPTAADELIRFRAAFAERYEEREVPLAEALDAEAGIGFPLTDEPAAEGSPLLRGFHFPETVAATTKWGEREKFLLRKLSQALEDGATEINLETRELEKIFVTDPRPLPDALAVNATVATTSDEAVTRGDFRVLWLDADGPSGARMLGRFCHMDAGLEGEVQRHLEAEETLQPAAVFAEIVHLPEGRAGNVLARPVLRAYEIPFLGVGGGAPENQIPITDLFVSVRQNRFVLRSARLGREVIPRLTSAHDFGRRSVGVYRFLCLLQAQGCARALGWRWGALQSAPFLPRVTLGRLVLSLARWRLTKEELKQLSEPRGAKRFRAVGAWRKARRMPRLITLVEVGNRLPIDLENVLSVETFVDLIKSREDAVVAEMFPPPEQLCARGPEGKFVHELIIPFLRTTDEPAPAGQNLPRRDTPVISRTFPPGSEWLYAKLYAGAATVDQLLRDVVSDLAAEAMSSGAVDHWFFIRNAEPDWHVRLRFHGPPERLHAEVMPAMQAAVAPLLNNKLIWRVQFDTYEREVERYGGAEGIALAERIFHIDSEAVLEMVERLDQGDAGLDERWRLALRGIDLLLCDFGFSDGTKRAVLRKARTVFAREFRADTKLRKQIGERFRHKRKELDLLRAAERDAETSLTPGFEILRRRSARLAPLIAELKACESAGRLSASLEELAPSFIHMHVNRLLRSAQRAHELVLYEFLLRLQTRPERCGQPPEFALEIGVRDTHRTGVGSHTPSLESPIGCAKLAMPAQAMKLGRNA